MTPRSLGIGPRISHSHFKMVCSGGGPRFRVATRAPALKWSGGVRAREAPAFNAGVGGSARTTVPPLALVYRPQRPARIVANSAVEDIRACPVDGTLFGDAEKARTDGSMGCAMISMRVGLAAFEGVSRRWVAPCVSASAGRRLLGESRGGRLHGR